MSKEVFIHGICPRSEGLITATQGLERKRVGSEEVTTLQASDRRTLIGLQNPEHFSLIEDGKLTWQDIFRPLESTCKGFKPGAEDELSQFFDTHPRFDRPPTDILPQAKQGDDGDVTRWFDNNSFYRKPVITGRLIPDFSALDEYFPQVAETSRWKVTLPSPFTFAKLCEDRTTEKFEGTLENITQLISLTIRHLQARGVSFVQLNEPYVPYNGSQQEDIDGLVKSLKSIRAANKTTRLGLHSYFGDSAPLAKRLETEGVVDAIGVDFLQTQIGDLPTSTEHDLIAGVVDGRNSDIEAVTELSPFIDQIQEHARPTTIYVTHNTDLEFLPETVARRKVQLIGSLK